MKFYIGDLDLTEAPFATLFGGDPGSPQNVAEVVDSMLQDGEIISSTRSSNRTMKYTVLIEEGDAEALAEAEQRLIAETDKQNNIWTIDPDDGVGAITQFEIFRVQVAFIADDDREMAGYRLYDLTIPALPFGMSANEVIDVALDASATPATSVIADGTSATGWTSVDGTVTASGGVLHTPTHWTVVDYPGKTTLASGNAYYQNRRDQFEFKVTKTLSAFNFTTYPYLAVDLVAGTPSAGTANAPFGIAATVDGVPVPLVTTQTIAAKTIRATFLVSDSSASTMTIAGGISVVQYVGGSASHIPPQPTCEIQFDNVIASNTPPASSTTGREVLRSINITGSARTSGRIAIEHETKPLGDVMVYSRPGLDATGTPDMRRYRTTGAAAPTSSPASISGFVETLGTSAGSATTFRPPTSSLPSGAYLVYARVGSASGTITPTISASASTIVGTTPVGLQTVTADPVTLSSGAANYQFAEVGEFTLPPADVPDGSAAQIELKVWSSVGNTSLDELFVFYAGEGSALSIVRAGNSTSPVLGTAHNRLWLDTPTLARPQFAIWLGTAADRSDAFFGGSFADGWGMHPQDPGEAQFFLINTGDATFPRLSVAHRPRWWLNARRQAS